MKRLGICIVMFLIMSVSVMAFTKDYQIVIVPIGGASLMTYGYSSAYQYSAQTWNTSQSNLCNWGVNITLRKGGFPADFTYVQCENTTAGLPNGKICHVGMNGSISNSVLTGSFAYHEINFTTCGNIDAYKTYASTIKRTGVLDSFNYMQVQIYNSADAYLGGSSLRYGSGVWGIDQTANEDMGMTLYFSFISSVNDSVSTIPILSDVKGTQTSLFYTNITNYFNNTATQRVVWTVNSTSGLILKNATNATGRFLNCSSYPQCKGDSIIFARGITENGVAKSLYSASKSVLILSDFIRVDFVNSSYLPINNTWNDGSYNAYFKPVSDANNLNCSIYKNATLYQTKENLTANFTSFFLIGVSIGEQSTNSYSVSCTGLKKYANGMMTDVSGHKTFHVDTNNPIINIWNPFTNGQRFYQSMILNVTTQNYLINSTYMKIYDNSGQIAKYSSSNYAYYLKNYIKSLIMGNVSGTKHKGYVEIYTQDYVLRQSNSTKFFYIMNCSQLSENWQTNYLQSCQTTDTRAFNYIDSNGCGTFIDNITDVLQIHNGSCNYCTSTYSHIDSACSNGFFQRSYHYTNPCCAFTGLSSDCNIPMNQNLSCSAPITGYGISAIMGESGFGIGEFMSGVMSGGTLPKLILVLSIIGGVVALIAAVVFVIKSGLGKI